MSQIKQEVIGKVCCIKNVKEPSYLVKVNRYRLITATLSTSLKNVSIHLGANVKIQLNPEKPNTGTIISVRP